MCSKTVAITVCGKQLTLGVNFKVTLQHIINLNFI